jgi:hypothetical protein
MDPAAARPAFGPVVPVVRLHVQDAAQLWTMLGDVDTATHLRARRAAELAQVLDAHLEGLDVAGKAAHPLALEELARWRKPGEAFVASYGALLLPQGPDREAAMAAVLQCVARLPDLLLRGFVSALAWVPADQAEPWLANALMSDDAVWRVAALRACALRGLPAGPWDHHAAHGSAHVRAAACRAAGPEQLDALHGLRGDADRAVRAESVLAWARLVAHDARDPEDLTAAASLLWRCVVEQLGVLASATGWNRLQAQRRLARWLRQLAGLAPVGHPGVPQLLGQLPLRQSLAFVLHHGDVAMMPFLLRALSDPQQARWAGWIWQCLTGVDLRAAGLVQAEPPIDSEALDAPLTHARQDADLGLPLPQPAAIAAHPASAVRLAPGQRQLMGQPVQEQALRAMLDPAVDLPQALRAVAAHALGQLHPALALNLRASIDVQAAQLASLGLHP